MNKITIYRIQDMHGVGMYRSRLAGVQIGDNDDLSNDYGNERHPLPQNDSLLAPKWYNVD